MCLGTIRALGRSQLNRSCDLSNYDPLAPHLAVVYLSLTKFWQKLIRLSARLQNLQGSLVLINCPVCYELQLAHQVRMITHHWFWSYELNQIGFPCQLARFLVTFHAGLLRNPYQRYLVVL